MVNCILLNTYVLISPTVHTGDKYIGSLHLNNFSRRRKTIDNNYKFLDLVLYISFYMLYVYMNSS